ncbi:MAG TPA: intradiol ring-cleavage dioxygenase, partial [Blastococcus sp.]
AAGTASGSASAAAAGASGADCAVISEETAGPFPGDGSNGPDILTQSGVVRKDIRASLGSTTTVAQGVPLTIRLAIQDQANNCAPLAGAAVYVWHCDRDGNYSMYSSGVENETYLRGVQAVDANGVATFTSIFPACYPGRWPHVHFEVYKSLDEATAAGQILATSQLALPGDVCSTVYATTGYEQSVSNLSRVSLTRDMVFGDDGGVSQLATMTGSVSGGYTAALTVGL